MNHCSYCCLYSHNIVHHCCVCKCPYHSTHQCPFLSGNEKVKCCGHISKPPFRIEGKESSFTITGKNDSEKSSFDDGMSENSSKIKPEFDKCSLENSFSSTVEQAERKNKCAHGILSCCNLCCSGILDGKSYCCKQCALKLMSSYEKYSLKKPSEFIKSNSPTKDQISSSCDYKAPDDDDDVLQCGNYTVMQPKHLESLVKKSKSDILVNGCKSNQLQRKMSLEKQHCKGISMECTHNVCKGSLPKNQISSNEDNKQEVLVDCDNSKITNQKCKRSLDKLNKEDTLVVCNSCKNQESAERKCNQEILVVCESCKIPKLQESAEKQCKQETHVGCNSSKMPDLHRGKIKLVKQNCNGIPMECTHNVYKESLPKRQISSNRDNKQEVLFDCYNCKIKNKKCKRSLDKLNKEDILIICNSCKNQECQESAERKCNQDCKNQECQESAERKCNQEILEDCEMSKITILKESAEKQGKKIIHVKCNSCKMTLPQRQISYDKNDKQEVLVECNSSKMILQKHHESPEKEILVVCSDGKGTKYQEPPEIKHKQEILDFHGCQLNVTHCSKCSDKHKQEILVYCDHCKITQPVKCQNMSPDELSKQISDHSIVASSDFDDGKKNFNECRKCRAVMQPKCNELVVNKKIICYEVPVDKKKMISECETCVCEQPEQIVQVCDSCKNVSKDFTESKNRNLTQHGRSDELEKDISRFDIVDFKCGDCKEITIKCKNCMMKQPPNHHIQICNKKPDKKKGTFFSCCNGNKKHSRKSKPHQSLIKK